MSTAVPPGAVPLGSNGGPSPTSVIENGQATFCVSTLNSHLTCTLCNGLFRNATTITECLHTFC
ncbi:hypothetical protein TrRE_jg1082, partial [Triparma retinervis]